MNKSLLKSIVLLVVVIVAAAFIIGRVNRDITRQPPKSRIVGNYLIEVPDVYTPVNSLEAGVPTNMTDGRFTIGADYPQSRFEVGDYWVELTLLGAEQRTPSIHKNSATYKNAMAGVDVSFTGYDGYLNQQIVINEPRFDTRFSFSVHDSGNVMYKEEGGRIVVYARDSGEQVFVLRQPQGFDSNNYAMDFKYYVNGEDTDPMQILEHLDKLTLVAYRSEQLKDATYPITLQPSFQIISWDEALVNVGERGPNPEHSKDGDIIQVKPAGWNWGARERKEFLIVRIPKLTEAERRDLNGRTLTDPDPALPEEEPRRAFLDNLIRYGMDYPSLVTEKELAIIRNPELENPILDARENIKVVQKKHNLLASVIPQETRLAYKPSTFTNKAKKLAEQIIRPAHAQTVYTESIGSGSCGGSCDRTTVAAWITACGGATSCDLEGNNEAVVGEMYDDSTFTETETDIDGFTTDATRTVTLTVAAGERHAGVLGDGVDWAAANDLLDTTDDYVTVEWIQFRDWGSGSAAKFALDVGRDNGTIRNNIFFGGTTPHDTAAALIFESNADNGEAYNNIIYNLDKSGSSPTDDPKGFGITDNSSSGGNDFSNNTVYNARGGIVCADATTDCLLRNNLAAGNSTDFGGTFHASSQYNMSEDQTGDDPGTTGAIVGATSTLEFINITAGSEDLRLRGGSVAIDSGEDLSGTFTDDIDGTTRPAVGVFDIGADEYNHSVDETTWWNTSWTQRRKITFDNSSQYEGMSSSTVAVKLSEQKWRRNIDYVATQGSGQDIRFVDSDNTTALPYEIERWNESGTSTVWVLVPSIVHASSTDHIWMYYGNSGASDNATTTGAWDQDYQAVIHLTEAVNNTSDGYTDSSGEANHGSGTSMALTEQPGIAGLSQDFDGSADFIEITDVASLRPGAGPYTLEAWFNAPDANQTAGSFVSKSDGDNPRPGINMMINGAEGSQSAGQSFRAEYQSDSSTDTERFFPNNDVADTQWHFGAITVDGSNSASSYLDGSVVTKTTDTGTPNPTNTNNLGIAAREDGGGGSFYTGLVDEVRVSTVERSTDRLAFQYCNITETCNTYGDLETLVDSSTWWDNSWTRRRRIDLDNSSQSTALNYFPASVQLTEDAWRNNIDYAQTQGSGQDIRFVDSDNVTELYYEIEKWDETGTSTLFVNVHNIAAASSTDHIWMYYGNTGASDNSTTTGVWDENFVMIHHMNNVYDSTREGNFANNNGAATTTSLAKVPDGFDFEQSDTTDWLEIADDDSLDLTDEWTISVLVDPESYPGNGNFDFLVSKDDGGTGLNYYLDIAGESGDAEIECGFYSGDYRFLISNDQDIIAANSPSFMQCTWDDANNEMSGWVNGTEVGNSPTTITQSPVVNSNTLRLGADNAGGSLLDGVIDEVRISSVERSDDFLAFEHCNVMDTCTTYNSEEEGGSPSNVAPTITSVTDTPDPTNPSRSVTFITDWNDADSGDLTKTKICRTDSLTGQVCDGGFWASSSVFSSQDPFKLKYDVVGADAGQTRSYYVFVCDDDAECSASTSGTFSVNTVSTQENIFIRGGTIIR